MPLRDRSQGVSLPARTRRAPARTPALEALAGKELLEVRRRVGWEKGEAAVGDLLAWLLEFLEGASGLQGARCTRRER